MKRLIVIASMLVVFAAPAYAETVTCTSEQYGGAVCGVSTSTETVVEHKVVETGIADSQAFKLLLTLFGASVVASLLYKLTYKSYILG